METLRRPLCVRERTLCVPELGAPHDPTTSHKLTRPTLSHVTFYSAQPPKTVPGHTGFLTFATLPPRSPPAPQPPSSSPAPPPSSLPPPPDHQEESGETVTSSEMDIIQ